MLGIFDSGIGGLTVVKELLRRAPDVGFLYLGDTARTPYGTKGEQTIIRYALEDAESLIAHGATAIIVACNTVSAYAMPALRERYPSVLFFDVLTPAIAAVASDAKTHVGIIGTSATVRSGAYESAIKAARPDLQVTSVACPLFVPLVEEGWIDDEVTRMVVARYLAPLKEAGVDTIVLGCTHYPLLQSLIAEVMGDGVKIIDSPKAVLDQIAESHPELLAGVGEQHYWFSDVQPSTAKIANRWLERPVEIKQGQFKNSL